MHFYTQTKHSNGGHENPGVVVTLRITRPSSIHLLFLFHDCIIVVMHLKDLP